MKTIAITMGDAAGIGPEIIVKGVVGESLRDRYRFIILGQERAMRRAEEICGIELGLRVFREQGVLDPDFPGPVLIDLGTDLKRDIPLGGVNADAGLLAARCIEKGARLALSGAADAMVTCPINKEAVALAGFDFPGHTEFLAHLTGARKVVMMLAGDRLRVTLVTIHEALANVPSLLNREKILDTIMITNEGLQRDFGLNNPHIAVAGFNPHAGEGGMFGREEIELISPVVQTAREQGIDASGPWPPDTIFYKAAKGEFDAVVCMYHDQGLIPLKLLHFHDGVNVTLGLPIVRVSVDHGTAFDIAGKGVADPASFINAVKTAGMIAGNRQAGDKRVMA